MPRRKDVDRLTDTAYNKVIMILINSSPKDALKIFQPFLPIYVPVGIGFLLAMAEKEGIPARIIDEQVEDDTVRLVGEYVKGIDPPYLFGFSVLTAAFKQAVVVARELKERYPDSIICFGGIHPTAAPDEVLSYPFIDVVIRGEGEFPLIDLYRCVKDRRDFSRVSGLSYRSNGRVVHNDRAPGIVDLNSLPPFPYSRFTSGKYDLGFVISSRGCPHQCIFCSNRITTGRRYRVRSADVIVDEISMLYQRYQVRQILFLDDNLLVNKERIYHLMEEIRKKGFHKKMAFNFQARGDNVTEQLLKDLYESGFKSVFFGLETASERIMKLIRKGETVAQCVDAVRMAKRIGFHVSGTFVYALPGETHEDRMDCISLARELDLDMVRFNNATPYPGTELYEIARQQNKLRIQGLYENFVSVSTFVENPFKPIPFSYVPEGNTEEEIRRDILFSYFSYYLDWKRLKSIFTRPDLGVGWFNAGRKFVEVIKKMPSLAVLGLMMLFKFGQLFYFSVLKRETAISLRFFLGVFGRMARGGVKGDRPGNTE
jgi:anaerobic magnesium-protoporphyrin IX monomethyl ester cyclase